MVTVLEAPQRKPSFGERLNAGIGRGLESATQMVQEDQRKKAISKLMGENGEEVANLPSDLQKLYIDHQLKIKEKASKLSDQQPGYEDIKKTFGEQFANVWKASEPGAQTELVKTGLDSLMRGDDVNEILSSAGASPVSQEEHGKIPENIPQLQKGKIPKDFQWPDFNKRPKGYTPKTWADQKTEWRKENSPIFTENVKKLSNTEKDILSTKVLHKLNKSKKLPEGLERLLINPETNDFYGPAQVLGFKSPEAQQWSKVIAQYQNRAKDAFGSRVTNFDLQSYMQQFPGLLNTTEGRDRILRMMDINYELDELYSKSMDEIYKHYRLDGIPYEKADELSRAMISKRAEELKNEYVNLNNENEQESGQVEKLSGKMVDVLGPNGKLYEVDQSQVGELPPGYKVQ